MFSSHKKERTLCDENLNFFKIQEKCITLETHSKCRYGSCYLKIWIWILTTGYKCFVFGSRSRYGSMWICIKMAPLDPDPYWEYWSGSGSSPGLWNSITNLRDSNATFPGEFLLGLLAGVGVRQVRVEVLVEDLGGLLAEVAPLASGVQEPGPQDHDRLAGALL